jgi:retron-type reverse transcriptase
MARYPKRVQGNRVVGSISDPVRASQHALYRSAKADPERRFHSLHDKVYRRDVMSRAWVSVRANNGAPGIDKVTLAEVEEYGVDRLLDELAEDLRNRQWRPLPARRVLIPKPGTAEKRPLSIPSVRDRIVQAALKIVLEQGANPIGVQTGRSVINGCARRERINHALLG